MRGAVSRESEDAAEDFLDVLRTRYGQVPYALAVTVLMAEAANPRGGPAAWLAFHALKLLLRRIAVHFEDVADALGPAKSQAPPLVELARQAREGNRSAVDVLAFLTVHAMAPGSGSSSSSGGSGSP